MINHSSDTKVLPLNELEGFIEFELTYDDQLDLARMKSQQPAVYYSLLDHEENLSPESTGKIHKKVQSRAPYLNQSVGDMINQISSLKILHHRLLLENDNTFAEIVVLVRRKQIVLLYLQLFPGDNTLSDVSDISELYQKLLLSVTANLVAYSANRDCEKIVAVIHNPCLVKYFNFAGFKQDSKTTSSSDMKNANRMVLTI